MTLKGHKPETPDWKRSTKIIQSVIDSIEPSALVSMREYAASVVSDGKRPRCGKLIRRESSKTLCRLKSACTLYSSTANHEQFETVCKMICGVISIPSCKSCGIKFYGPGTFCSRDCIQSNFQLGTKERNARREATCLKKYGSSHVSKVEKLKAKARQTNLERRGCEYPTQSEAVLRKRDKNHMRKHGVRNPMQRPEVFLKARSSLFVSKPVRVLGKDMMVQGYEADVLLKLEHRMKRVTVSQRDIPVLEYTGTDGKRHRYFPDALIETKDRRNILLEVKSDFTIQDPLVPLKAAAADRFCEQYSNLEYWIAVYHPKSDHIQWIDRKGIMKRLQEKNGAT